MAKSVDGHPMEEQVKGELFYCWKNGTNIFIPSKAYDSVNCSIKL